MPATTFFVPVLQGKTEEFKQIIADVTGPRSSEYEGMLRRYSVKLAHQDRWRAHRQIGVGAL